MKRFIMLVTSLRAPALVLVIGMLAIGAAGCSKPAATTSPPTTNPATTSSTASDVVPGGEPASSGFAAAANTAQGRFDVADKAIKATVPDAELMAVQTGDKAITDYPSATWMYLFASKATGKAHVISVTNGVAGSPEALTVQPLKEAERATIPAVTDWKIDSGPAYEKASAAYVERFGAPVPKSYGMAMNLFISEAMSKESADAKPFMWRVTFLQDDKTPRIITLDAKSGEVLPASQ